MGTEVLVQFRIVRGHQLPKADLMSDIDPYVQVTWDDRVFTTRYFDNDPNPVWNEDFFLDMTMDEEGRILGSLQLDLYDKESWGYPPQYCGWSILDFESVVIPDQLSSVLELPLTYPVDKASRFSKQGRSSKLCVSVVGWMLSYRSLSRELASVPGALLFEEQRSIYVPVPENRGRLMAGVRYTDTGVELRLCGLRGGGDYMLDVLCFDEPRPEESAAYEEDDGASRPPLRTIRRSYARGKTLMPGLTVYEEVVLPDISLCANFEWLVLVRKERSPQVYLGPVAHALEAAEWPAPDGPPASAFTCSVKAMPQTRAPYADHERRQIFFPLPASTLKTRNITPNTAAHAMIYVSYPSASKPPKEAPKSYVPAYGPSNRRMYIPPADGGNSAANGSGDGDAAPGPESGEAAALAAAAAQGLRLGLALTTATNKCGLCYEFVSNEKMTEQISELYLVPREVLRGDAMISRCLTFVPPGGITADGSESDEFYKCGVAACEVKNTETWTMESVLWPRGRSVGVWEEEAPQSELLSSASIKEGAKKLMKAMGGLASLKVAKAWKNKSDAHGMPLGGGGNSVASTPSSRLSGGGSSNGGGGLLSSKVSAPTLSVETGGSPSRNGSFVSVLSPATLQALTARSNSLTASGLGRENSLSASGMNSLPSPVTTGVSRTSSIFGGGSKRR